MTAAQAKASVGPTSMAEQARLTGGFADWHNLIYRAMWITGPLDKAAVRDAWRRVCRRHDVLRRTYVSADEALTHDDALNEVEFSSAGTDEEALDRLRDFLKPPFSLDGPAFARVAVVQCGEQKYLLGVALDHIIGDLISWRRIRADFTEFYRRALAGDDRDLPATGSYHDFASEQRRLFAGQWGQERRAFWRGYREQFGAYPPPFLADAKHTGDYQLKVAVRDLPPDTRARVQALSRQARVTSFAVIAAGVLEGVREVVDDPAAGIIVNHHGRTLAGTAETVGLFAETVPLHLGRTSSSPLDKVREVFHRTFDVFEYAIPLVVAGGYWHEELTATGRANAGIHVDLQEQPMSSLFTPLFTGLGAEHVDLTLPGDNLWPETVVLSWNLYDTGPQIVADYNAGYFPDAAVEDLLDAAQRFVLSASS
jgi:hypothetical protein